MKNLSLSNFIKAYKTVLNNKKIGFKTAILYDTNNDYLFTELIESDSIFITYPNYVKYIDLDYYLYLYQNPSDDLMIVKCMYMDYTDSKLKYIGERWYK